MVSLMDQKSVSFVLLGGISLLRAFAGSRHPVLVVPPRKHDVVRHSRVAARIAPFSFEEELLKGETWLAESLCALVEGQPAPPALIYGDDKTLEFVSRNRHGLRSHYKLLLPDPQIVEDCLCKARFAQLAVKHGLPVATTVRSTEPDVTSRVEATLGYPCLIKPFTHQDWHREVSTSIGDGAPRKALVAHSRNELLQIDARMRHFDRKYVVQTLIPGGEQLVYSYHAIVGQESEVLSDCVGKKIRTWPAEMGESAFIELVEEPAVLQLGRRIVATLGLIGPLKVDLKQNAETGEFTILEVNLRYSLWTHLISAAGISYPELALYHLRGQEDEIGIAAAVELRAGLAWLRFGADRRSWWRYYRRKQGMSGLAWLRSLLRPTVHPIFALTDPVPFINTLFRRLKRDSS